MKKILLLFMVLCLVIVGCSKDYKVRVKSNTSWSGAFGNRTVEGTGSTTVDIPDDPPECCVVQKDTEEGYLTIQIIEEGGGLLNPTNDYEEVTTTAAYGLVSACSEE